MRGDTTAENDLEADEHGGTAAASSGERRPSIAVLQNMLKKVSHSPFHQYQTLVPSISDSSGSSVNESQNKQDGELLMYPSAAASGVTDNHQPLMEQNGVTGDLARMNPFLTNHLESVSKGGVMEDVWRETSEEVNLDTIFVPPPDFQSSPLDLQPEMKTVEKGAEFSELPKDPFKTLTPSPMQDPFQTPALAPNTSSSGYFHDVTLNSPDLFKPNPAQTQNLSKTSQLTSSELFEDGGFNLFQAAKGEDLLHAERTREVNLFDKSPSIFVDPFKSPSNKEDELFPSPQPETANPFYTASPKEADLSPAVPSGEISQQMENKRDPFMREDLFGMSSFKDVFSSSSTNAVDPFPSPITRDLFQDVSSLDDPFGTTPSGQCDPFQDVSLGTPDIFKPLSSNTNSRDVFGMTSTNTAPKATYSTPSINNTSDMKPDMLSPLDLFKAKTSESDPVTQPESSDRVHDIFLTTPHGTKHDILQPSPFSRARNLSMVHSKSPSEMTHVSTFRRPPKPLPRIRPPRTEKTPKPENPIEPKATEPKVSPKPAFRPAPKPAVHPKPKTPETKPMEPENSAVFEDVLLLGQERCVEDWADNSPELNPGFKPSGTLRLRRESLKIKADSDDGSVNDQDGSVKKKDKKFRLSLLSRRGSKEKFSDDAKEGKSRSLPNSRKSSKDYFSEMHISGEDNEEGEQSEMDYKKKPLKTRGSKLRRASFTSMVPEGKHMNGHLPQESKGDDINEKSIGKKNSIIRRWSEGKVLDDSNGEEEEEEEMDEEGEDQHKEKKKKKLAIRFVPHRGFAITVEKGARGHTPRKNSKDKSQEDFFGAHGYTPRKKSQDDFGDVGHSLQSTSKAAFMDDEHFYETHHKSGGFNEEEDPYGMEDCKPKKTKMKLLHIGQRNSKEDMLDFNNHQKKKGSFSADELYDEDQMADCKPKTSKHKGPTPLPRKSKTANGQSEPIGFSQQKLQQASNDDFAEDDFADTRKYVKSPGEMYDEEEDEVETCKLKKKSKLKGFMKHKSKSKATQPEWEDPPGATSRDFLSEAAQAEWQAAQMDERAMAGLEDGDADGDTDSLMEWWNTVEQWDEVPSDDEDKFLKEDESKSFTILADKVHRGLRVYNKVFTERAEALWQSVITLHAIADNINDFHNKAKIAGITGGTTTAVGGVTAITGLVLAPFTFGASLIITAVGVGVATAGGIASASAAISDNVNNMHDRKKVEIILEQYEAHLQAVGKTLHYVNQGLYKLRGHPFLRSGTQHYSETWEIRRAVQMISLADSPVMRATEVTDASLASVQGLFKGIDKYFTKDSRELKKGCKKEVVMQIKEVANVLNDGVVELNAIREELQDATGNM
ncbi:uncharacterized protein si:cabz01007807.1 isoform X2 [Anoplopoma fimbria]|uniref:uncharacterized protein si:cabz01007807.1 isoform X2 n=1 Tax=Anoplopoma fimbria TaxID=229290 RepID=UPI0023EBD09B|nr:uncharacterized protein si:cabz01007807.1 isoform X2 [Anoplopoma fimbria]